MFPHSLLNLEAPRRRNMACTRNESRAQKKHHQLRPSPACPRGLCLRRQRFGNNVSSIVESGRPQSQSEILHGAVAIMMRNGDLMPQSLRKEGRDTRKARGSGDSPRTPPVHGDGVVGGYFHSSLSRPTPTAEASPATLHALIKAREERQLFDLTGLRPVCWTVIAGDLVHNFADGVTVGAALLPCSTTIGWTVTASAVLHEIPHELADFMALLHGGMSVKQVRGGARRRCCDLSHVCSYSLSCVGGCAFARASVVLFSTARVLL